MPPGRTGAMVFSWPVVTKLRQGGVCLRGLLLPSVACPHHHHHSPSLALWTQSSLASRMKVAGQSRLHQGTGSQITSWGSQLQSPPGLLSCERAPGHGLTAQALALGLTCHGRRQFTLVGQLLSSGNDCRTSSLWMVLKLPRWPERPSHHMALATSTPVPGWRALWQELRLG